MPEIQKADRKARQTAIWLIAAVATLGAALIAWVEFTPAGHGPEVWVQDRRLLLGALVLLSLLVLCGAILMLHLGWRVAAAGRFPPPGMVVVRDTPIRNGWRARIGGYAIMACALIVLATALRGAMMLLALMQSLFVVKL